MARLADAINANNANRPGPECSVTRLLANLDADDAADFRAALADPSILASAVWNGLRAVGHRVGYDAIRRHRRGLCGCAR